MQGLRFFSIFTFVLLSLFIQKTCHFTSLLSSDETFTTAEKTPVIQISGLSKFVSKQKTHKSVFLASSSVQVFAAFETADEKILIVFNNLPKPSFDNPSRAPPVV
jgi:hypothetical protein